MSFGAANNAGSSETELDSSAATSSATFLATCSSGGDALVGTDAGTGTGNGVSGQLSNSSNAAAAVYGVTSGTGQGVQGAVTNSENSQPGVYGVTNGSGAGVAGQNTGTGAGVFGEVTNGTNTQPGVFGYTTGMGAGVEGEVNNAGNTQPAVYGVTNGTGPGVFGQSTSGYGVAGIGGRAPLWLQPAGAAGPPAAGAHFLGEVYVDSAGVFYRCVVDGTPGTWVQFRSTIPLAVPVRVLDTTNGTGGLSGPFAPDGTTHTTSVLTGGSTGIPDIAVGVVGNLAISGSGATLNGDGFLTLWPAGTANPGTSSLNCGGDAFSTANGVTVGLGTGGSAGKLSFSWQGGGSPLPCQVFLDVTAFIL